MPVKFFLNYRNDKLVITNCPPLSRTLTVREKLKRKLEESGVTFEMPTDLSAGQRPRGAKKPQGRARSRSEGTSARSRKSAGYEGYSYPPKARSKRRGGDDEDEEDEDEEEDDGIFRY